MKRIITTFTLVCTLTLTTAAFTQIMEAGAEVPTVVETVPPDRTPAPEPTATGTEPAAEEPAPDHAAADTAKSAFSQVMTHAIELLATLLMVLFSALVAKATSYFTKKTKIEISAKTEELIATWGGKAVNYAKEKAHQYNAEKGEAMTGPEKLEIALSFGISLVDEHKIASLTEAKLTKYIESHLGEKRMPGLSPSIDNTDSVSA